MCNSWTATSINRGVSLHFGLVSVDIDADQQSSGTDFDKTNVWISSAKDFLEDAGLTVLSGFDPFPRVGSLGVTV
jgi:hypothetical protein